VSSVTQMTEGAGEKGVLGFLDGDMTHGPVAFLEEFSKTSLRTLGNARSGQNLGRKRQGEIFPYERM